MSTRHEPWTFTVCLAPDLTAFHSTRFGNPIRGLLAPNKNRTNKACGNSHDLCGHTRTMKMAPCPATSGSWQVLEVLGDGGSGEGPSFKKGLPPKMHFHRNQYNHYVTGNRGRVIGPGATSERLSPLEPVPHDPRTTRQIVASPPRWRFSVQTPAYASPFRCLRTWLPRPRVAPVPSA